MLVTSSEHSTIPLHIVQENQYEKWLSQQAKATIHWLENTNFKPTNVSLVPHSNGELAMVLYVAADLSDFFTCGQLANVLPPLAYELVADSIYHEAIAFGWLAGCYKFDRYKKSNQEQPSLLINNKPLVKQVTLDNRAQSLVRDMVNTPAADMMPQDIAQIAQSITAEYGGEVTQIIGDELIDKNYPTIHAVGRASDNTPQLIDLRWGDKNAPKVTLVGKGVCFDSGGLDLKPAAGMRNMKKDMGGAAHVLGLAQLIMGNNLPVQLRVLIPAVENAVSANALRPGDVITTRAGITVEIDNTDAEGRLVLCDAISEAIT